MYYSIRIKGERKNPSLSRTSLSTLFFERVSNLVYVETEVLHAGLNDTERVEPVKRFNDLSDLLTFLIIMYQVKAQGVNRDRYYARAIVATPAINAPSEIQTWSRIIRNEFVQKAYYVFHTGYKDWKIMNRVAPTWFSLWSDHQSYSKKLTWSISRQQANR